MISKFKQQAKQSPTKTIKKRSVASEAGETLPGCTSSATGKNGGKEKKYSTWKMSSKDGGVIFLQQHMAPPPGPTSHEKGYRFHRHTILCRSQG